MKYLYISLLLIISSCKMDVDDGVDKKVLLERQNVSVMLKIPIEFDTYQKAFKHSDCGCRCESIKYRFSNSNYDNRPKRDTIPWVDTVEKTEVYKEYSFIISHNSCTNNISLDDSDFEKEMKKELEEHVILLKTDNPSIRFLIDEKTVIDNRFFRIIGYKEKSDFCVSEIFKAYTMVNGKLLEFNGFRIDSEKEDLDNSVFFNEVYGILKSVKIKKL